jgi:hypothetical protein
MVRGEFKVRSLEGIGTVDTDFDIGVVRVSAAFLRRHAKRNALIRISVVGNDGHTSRSIVRVVRAATGKKALRANEIALQYDDRVDLGIKKAGGIHTLQIDPVNSWLGLPQFLLGHPSPLVRKDIVFSIALWVIGLIVGFIVGLAI